MFKWLLLFAGAGIFYLWLKGKKQAKFRAENSQDTSTVSPQELSTVEPMVQCHCCKVHLPQSETISYDSRFYCSKEHLQGIDGMGWIGDTQWRISPNQDARPVNLNPDLVVIHHISLPPGEFREQAASHHIVDFFQNHLDPAKHPYFAEIADQKVSSHFLITRTGELIQFVSIHARAWHAGKSSFFDREKCNDFSIGVELEGDGSTPFEESQYQVLASLIERLNTSLPNLQFCGHSDIAPGRKTDPGIYFDWEKIQKKTGISSEKFPFGLTSR